MAELDFPCWIVTQQRGLISKPVQPGGMPGFIAAFFMVSRGGPEWENRLVTRSTLRDLMAHLRLLGMQSCASTPPGKVAGTQIAFDDLQRV